MFLEYTKLCLNEKQFKLFYYCILYLRLCNDVVNYDSLLASKLMCSNANNQPDINWISGGDLRCIDATLAPPCVYFYI